MTDPNGDLWLRMSASSELSVGRVSVRITIGGSGLAKDYAWKWIEVELDAIPLIRKHQIHWKVTEHDDNLYNMHLAVGGRKLTLEEVQVALSIERLVEGLTK